MDLNKNAQGIIQLYEKFKQEYKNMAIVRIVVWFVMICAFCSLYFLHIHPHVTEAQTAINNYNQKRNNASKNYNLSIDMLTNIRDIMEKSIAETGGDYMLYLDYHNSGAGVLGYKGFSHVKASLQLVAVRDEKAVPFIDFYDFLYNIPARKLDVLYSSQIHNKGILYIGDLANYNYFYQTRNMFCKYGINTLCARELTHIGETKAVQYGVIIILARKKNAKINNLAVERMIFHIDKRVNYLLNETEE